MQRFKAWAASSARGAWSAVGGAAELVMIGLVAEYGTVGIFRQRQTEKLEPGERVDLSDRFDVGDVSFHRAAGTERQRHLREIIAVVLRARGVQSLLVGTGKCGGAPE